MLAITSSFLTSSPCTLVSPMVLPLYKNNELIPPVLAYSLAKPAFRTAVDMAFMAVNNEFSNNVRLPVAPDMRLCSLRTKRVNVMESTSISPLLVAIVVCTC